VEEPLAAASLGGFLRSAERIGDHREAWVSITVIASSSVAATYAARPSGRRRCCADRGRPGCADEEADARAQPVGEIARTAVVRRRREQVEQRGHVHDTDLIEPPLATRANRPSGLTARPVGSGRRRPGRRAAPGRPVRPARAPQAVRDHPALRQTRHRNEVFRAHQGEQRHLPAGDEGDLLQGVRVGNDDSADTRPSRGSTIVISEWWAAGTTRAPDGGSSRRAPFRRDAGPRPTPHPAARRDFSVRLFASSTRTASCPVARTNNRLPEASVRTPWGASPADARATSSPIGDRSRSPCAGRGS